MGMEQGGVARKRAAGVRKSIIAVLAVAACCVFAVGVMCGCAKKVEVPDLYVMEQDEALQVLSDAGLKMGNITEQQNPDVPFGGFILSQTPAAGESVDEGTAVDIVVSVGPSLHEPTTVPDLTGMTPEQAEEALFNAMIIPQPGAPTYSDTVAPGKVCAQSIPASSKIMPFEDSVTYSVSLGKEKVKVPDVAGKPVKEAREALDKAGLGCDTTFAYNDKVAKDVVISQTVAKGTEVDKGTVVVIEISLGQKPVAQVQVPNIMTYDLAAAKRTLESAGLAYKFTGDEAGTVVSVTPVPGTKVDQGSTVQFVLKAPAQTAPANATPVVTPAAQAAQDAKAQEPQPAPAADAKPAADTQPAAADDPAAQGGGEGIAPAAVEGSDGPDLAIEDIKEILVENKLGEYVESKFVASAEGDYWLVTVKGDDGTERIVLVEDENGTFHEKDDKDKRFENIDAAQ